MKAGEKSRTSRLKRLFSRPKKEQKKPKEEAPKQEEPKQVIVAAPSKPKVKGRTDIWSDQIDAWWAGTKVKRKETAKREREMETTRIKLIAACCNIHRYGFGFLVGTATVAASADTFGTSLVLS